MTVPNGLADRVRAIMDAHWRPEGFTVPSAASYPFRWLWDSCFHALVWIALGEDERAVAELRYVFRTQEPSGFVPHVDYGATPDHHAAFWGRPGTSTISQPPMAGHAVAELRRAGVDVDGEVAERAAAHLDWFVRERRHPSGLIAVRHPWETGCDDSPRWDHWGAADPATWYDVKGSLVRDAGEGFDAAPVSLTALVAFNRRELLGAKDAAAGELAGALEGRWDAARRTWVDAGAHERGSGRVRTLDGLLPLLVAGGGAAQAELESPDAFAAPFGPRGVHRAEPAYEPGRYWRGGVWPPLAYLLWKAGVTTVAAPTVRGAEASGFAEYWDPDTGAALGAVPQSWAGLALLMAGSSSSRDTV